MLKQITLYTRTFFENSPFCKTFNKITNNVCYSSNKLTYKHLVKLNTNKTLKLWRFFNWFENVGNFNYVTCVTLVGVEVATLDDLVVDCRLGHTRARLPLY